MYRFPLFATLFLATVSTPSLAFERNFDHCMGNAGGVTQDMLDCIGRAQASADQRISAHLRKALGGLSPARASALSTSQAAWSTYREAHCDFFVDPEGGTAATLAAADCRLSLTSERLDFLETLFDGDTVILRRGT